MKENETENKLFSPCLFFNSSVQISSWDIQSMMLESGNEELEKFESKGGI